MHLSAEMALQNRPGGRGLALVAIFTKKPGHCPFRSVVILAKVIPSLGFLAKSAATARGFSFCGEKI